MKKIIILFTALLIPLIAQAEVINAGISLDLIPRNLYGSWRVQAKLEQTNAPRRYRPQSLDFWNLSRTNDIIELDNPLSGANAKVSVETIEGNLVVFSKKLAYDDNKVLTDTVTIRLNGDKFSGLNTLKLEYFSLVDNHLMKTETATYHITGEKIAGESILIEDAVEPLNNTSF